MTPVPLEQTIAEAMIKANLQPREWKPPTKEELLEVEEKKAEAQAKARQPYYELMQTRMDIQNKLNDIKMDLLRLDLQRKLAKTTADIGKIKEETKIKKNIADLLDNTDKKIAKQGFIDKATSWVLRKFGIGGGKAPSEIETVPSPTIPKVAGTIPPEVQQQIDYIREQGRQRGLSEEEIEADVQELLNYYEY
jgi:hypothetical protein